MATMEKSQRRKSMVNVQAPTAPTATSNAALSSSMRDGGGSRRRSSASQPAASQAPPPPAGVAAAAKAKPVTASAGLGRGGLPSSRTASELLNLEGERFPSYEELQLLPEEIQLTLMELVMDYFRRRIYPRVLYLIRRKHKRQAVQQALPSTPPLTPAYLQLIQVFSKWTNLEGLARGADLQIFEKDDYIVFEGDRSASAIYFFVSGTVTCRKKTWGAGSSASGPPLTSATTAGGGGDGGEASGSKNAPSATPSSPTNRRGAPNFAGFKAKGIHDYNTQATATLEAPCAYGELIFLTDQPRTETLRAATRVFAWVLKRSTFMSYLRENPEPVQRWVMDYAYRVRCDNIRSIFPLTAAQLKGVPLFQDISEELLQGLVPRCEPKVFGANQAITRFGEMAHEFYFVVRGGISLSIKTVEGDVNEVATVGPGGVVGELPVLFVQRQNAVLRTTAPTDVYAISRDSVVAAIPSQANMSMMLQRAHAVHAEWQQHAKTRYRECIAQIPILRDLATPELVDELLEHFHPRVFPVHSTIVTVSECADRVVIPTRGKARLTAAAVDLILGEAVGFTCLVPHRWQFHAVALETVETIEIHFRHFATILKKYGTVHDDMKALTLGLLYPRVYPDAYQRVVPLLRSCRNPPSYPTSTAFELHPFAARTSGKVPAVVAPGVSRKVRAEIASFRPLPTKLPPLGTVAATTAAAVEDFMQRGADPDAATLPDANADATGHGARDGEGPTSLARHRSQNALLGSSTMMGGGGTALTSPSKSSATTGADLSPSGKRSTSVVPIANLSTHAEIERQRQRNAHDIAMLTTKIQQIQEKLGIKESPKPKHARGAPRKLPSLSPVPKKESRTVGCQTVLSYLRSRADAASKAAPATSIAAPPPAETTSAAATAAPPSADPVASPPPPAAAEAAAPPTSQPKQPIDAEPTPEEGAAGVHGEPNAPPTTSAPEQRVEAPHGDAPDAAHTTVRNDTQ